MALHIFVGRLEFDLVSFSCWQDPKLEEMDRCYALISCIAPPSLPSIASPYTLTPSMMRKESVILASVFHFLLHGPV